MTEQEYVLGVALQKFYGTKTELFSSSRGAEIVKLRFAYAFLLRYLLGWSFPRIGTHLNRDHTSVMYGVQEFLRKSNHVFNLDEIQRNMEREKIVRKRPEIAPVDRQGISLLSPVEEQLAKQQQEMGWHPESTLPPPGMHTP